MLKQKLKRSAQMAIARAAPALWRMRKNGLLVLMYHRVLPAGDQRVAAEQPGMWIQPASFNMHLQVLRRHFEVVRLADWIERAASNEALPRRACAITFDDGWRDNYEYAYPLLQAHGVPATIFVCPDLVGSRKQFWPERLAGLVRQLSATNPAPRVPVWLLDIAPAFNSPHCLADVDVVDRAIETAKRRYSDETMCGFLDQTAASVGAQQGAAERALLDWDELQEMLDSHLVDIGSHTRSHRRLSGELSGVVLQDEIVESKRMIEERMGVDVKLFCYPNGDAAPAAYDAVKAVYRGACSTRYGWHSASADPYLIRRIGVHEDIAFDETSFISRISAWI